jgi:hypothetical protein
MRKKQLVHAASIAVGFVLAALILTEMAGAQLRYGSADRDGYDVTCQSYNGRRKYCGSHPGTSVRLSQQLSRESCVQGQTWGMDGDRLWVDQDCGATFTFSSESRRDRGEQSVTCQSRNNRRVYCGEFPGARITLEQQTSREACVEGRTWGMDGNRLWTDDNCAATFRVQMPGGGSERGRRPRWLSRDPNDTWPPRGTWRGRNWERGGACFYKDADYGGEFFCLERGEEVRDLQEDNDKITSVRMFGGARVTIYEDNDFRGRSRQLSSDVRNLGGSWNDRVSSIRVE